jgi:hypothetical protein
VKTGALMAVDRALAAAERRIRTRQRRTERTLLRAIYEAARRLRDHEPGSTYAQLLQVMKVYEARRPAAHTAPCGETETS